MQRGVQSFQDFLTPGEERISQGRNAPVRGKGEQTGLQELASLLVIQMQMPGKPEYNPCVDGQIVPALPAANGIAVYTNFGGELLLGHALALAKCPEHLSKGVHGVAIHTILLYQITLYALRFTTVLCMA